MAVLERNKPIKRIDYDPSNIMHRNALQTFIDKGKWTTFFTIEENVHNQPYSLMIKTLNWYMKHGS